MAVCRAIRMWLGFLNTWWHRVGVRENIGSAKKPFLGDLSALVMKCFQMVEKRQKVHETRFCKSKNRHEGYIYKCKTNNI